MIDALGRQLSYQDDGTLLNDAPRPIEPDAAGATGVPLMRRFCSQPLPDIRAVESSQGTQYEICEGPIGNTATATWVFGWWTPAFASCYRDSENRFGEHTTHLFTPAELSICDLLVHRSLPVRLPPEPFLYSRLTGGPEYPAMGRDRNRLPLAEEVLDLGRTPPVVATPHIPRYPQMIEAVCERCGWKLEDFQGYRLMVRYPPIPTVAVLRFELPERS